MKYKKQIERGAWYLLPFTGPRFGRLVKAVRPVPGLAADGYWYCRRAGGRSLSIVNLSACARITPFQAKVIVTRRKIKDQKRAAK